VAAKQALPVLTSVLGNDSVKVSLTLLSSGSMETLPRQRAHAQEQVFDTPFSLLSVSIKESGLLIQELPFPCRDVSEIRYFLNVAAVKGRPD
jgi:hypothetical protein